MFPDDTQRERERSAGRDFDPGALLAGLLFVAIGVIYLLAAAGSITVNGQWIVAVLLLGLGVAGVVGVLRRHWRS